MSRIKMTDYDKAFIVGNNDKLLVRQMSAKLNLCDTVIRNFIKENNMKTLYQQNKPELTKPLQPGQECFIEKNCSELTLTELAKAVNNTIHAVSKHLKNNNLKAKKVFVKDIPQVKTTYDVVTQSFERPPAVYSNKSFHH